jgi:hypothetical protein
MRSFIGQTVEAITLNQQTRVLPSEHLAQANKAYFPEFTTEALTDNYLKLALAGKHDANRWVTAYVQAVSDGWLIAS